MAQVSNLFSAEGAISCQPEASPQDYLGHNHESASGKHSRDQAQPDSTRFVMLREAKHLTLSLLARAKVMRTLYVFV
jgi:hypothetical protein